MSAPAFNCWSVSKNYRTLKVWWFNESTRRLVMTTTVQVRKGMTRRERYDELCEYWINAKVTPPEYVPAKAERPPTTPASGESAGRGLGREGL